MNNEVNQTCTVSVCCPAERLISLFAGSRPQSKNETQVYSQKLQEHCTAFLTHIYSNVCMMVTWPKYFWPPKGQWLTNCLIKP